MSSATCTRCTVQYEQEHPRQTVCRVCMTARCPICRSYMTGVPRDATYCSHRCRQRARAGARYTLLGRDNFTCVRCGIVGDEDIPAFMRELVLFSWGTPRTATNTITMCRACAKVGVFSDLVTRAWEQINEKRNKFFAIDPNQPLQGLSRGEQRRRRKHRA